MFKRIVSLLLCLSFFASWLPMGAVSARAEEAGEEVSETVGGITITWESEGETREWNADLEDAVLPEGVAYDPDTVTLTLNGANLTEVSVFNFGDTRVSIVVEGENTVMGDGAEIFSIFGCSNVFVSGSGKLTVVGTDHPFSWNDFIYDESSEYNGMDNTDGQITFSGLTMDVTNISEELPEGATEDEWSYLSAIRLMGQNILVTDGAQLTCEGRGAIDLLGNLTVDNNAVLNGTGLHCNLRSNPDTGVLTDCGTSVTIKETGTVNLYRTGAPIGNHSLTWFAPSSYLALDGGSLYMDDSEFGVEYSTISMGSEDEAYPGAKLLINSGTLEVRANSLCGSIIHLGEGTRYIQTGGDVTMTADRSGETYFNCISMGDNSFFSLEGGSLTLENTCETPVEEPNLAAFAAFSQDSETRISDGTLTVRGNWHTGFNIQGKFTVTGGEVIVEDTIRQGTLFYLNQNASYLQTGGTVSLRNTNAVLAAEDVYTTYLNGMHISDRATATMTGGEFRVLGDVVEGILVNSNLLVNGTDVDIEALHICLQVGNRSVATILGGNVHLTASRREGRTGILMGSQSGLSMMGGSLDIDTYSGIWMDGGYARFMGGETRIEAFHSIYRNEYSEASTTYGDGIQAAYADGTEAAVDGDVPADYRPVTIRAQGVSGKETAVVMDLNNPSSVVSGVSTGVWMTVSLKNPSGTIQVNLGEGTRLVEGSVMINNAFAPYTLTDEGFALEANNSDYITFTILPTTSGEQRITVQAEDVTQTLDYTCKQYTLSLPSMVNSPEIALSGTAAANSTVTFYWLDQALGSAAVSELGTWSTAITLPDAEGVYDIHAIFTDETGAYLMATAAHRVTYQRSSPVVETLTVSNWIHGNTSYDPDELTSFTINYLTGERSRDYYIYWPELPEFTFEVTFAEHSGTPETVTDVKVVATDWQGVEQEVALRYDSSTDTWKGTGLFCDNAHIVPDAFRVEWRNLIPGLRDEEPEEEPEPVEVDEDYTSGAMTQFSLADGNVFTVELLEGSAVETLYDGMGRDVSYTIADNLLSFAVEAAEVYVIRLSAGGFVDYEDTLELTVLVDGETETVCEYQENVYLVSSEIFTDFNETTFTTEGPIYQVDDVLVIDGTTAIVVTEVHDATCTYTAAGLTDVFTALDVSSYRTDVQPTVSWELDEEALEDEVLQSDFYDAYLASIQSAMSEFKSNYEAEFELDDVSVKAEVSCGFDTDGNVFVEPSFTITTKGKTKLPVVGETETSISAKITYKVTENVDYRLRTDSEVSQSLYLSTDETVSTSLEIKVTLGENEDDEGAEAGQGAKVEYYFSDHKKYADLLEENVLENFLAELEEEDEKTIPLLDKFRFTVPTPVPACFLYVHPTVNLTWNLFGELAITGEVVNKTNKGITVIHRGSNYLGGWDDWSVTTFSNKEPMQLNAGVDMHLCASVALMVRCTVGVTLADCLDIGVYGEAGPKLTIDGHGTVSYSTESSADCKAELLATVTLEMVGGGTVAMRLSRLVNLGSKDFPFFRISIPLAQLGAQVMPTKFANVSEDPVQIPADCDLKEYIDLSLDCQNFKIVGSIAENTQVMDLTKYTFALHDGAIDKVTLTENGKLTVLDTQEEFEFRVKVTYTGSTDSYKLWKIVKLKYSPSSITIEKYDQDGNPLTAQYKVFDLTDPNVPSFGCSAGKYTFATETGHRYMIVETSCPPDYALDSKPRYVTATPGGHRLVFVNPKIEDPEPYVTPDITEPGSGDPSGFVFEGIESNRLSGVTTTVYWAQDESGTNAVAWNAEPFDQNNPLTTDELGQYMWMVPSGWWQVRYELEGYETETSEWMVVPPIRTEVNQAMTAYQPAEFTLTYSELMNCVLLKFNRPVKVNLEDFTLTVNAAPMNTWTVPLDADWSVTEDPADSAVCATVFRLDPEGDIHNALVDVSLTSETYAGVRGTSAVTGYSVPEAHVHSYSAVVKDATCTEGGYTTYTCSCGDRYVDDYVDAAGHGWTEATCTAPKTCSVCGETEGEALGHKYTSVVTAPACTKDGYTTHSCERCGDTYTDSIVPAIGHKWTEATCTEPKTCSVCGTTEGKALGHDYVDGKCSRCGEADPDYTVLESVSRIYGDNRVDTAFGIANQLKETLDVEKFDTIVVAYGWDFPDALTGSYLAAVKDAPILLTHELHHARVIDYIRKNLASDGKVYILGGTGAVDEAFEDYLAEYGIAYKRLGGDTRYETNLLILEEAGVGADQEILVCTSQNFADSLSASAAGLPILLVYRSLTDAQKEFLATSSGKFTIIGGTGAVSESLEEELKAFGTVTRLAGDTRYDTSVMVAKRFVTDPDGVVLAYGINFPDGLCGGPLAVALNAPLVLATDYWCTAADAYVEGMDAGVAVGGTGLISDETVREIFDLAEDAVIAEKKR